MKAGVLRDWRSRLRESNRIRSEAAAYFSRRLSIGLANGSSHPYLRLPILAATPAERDRIYAFSQRQGLGLGLAYPTPDQRDSRDQRHLRRKALSLRPASCRTPLDHPDAPLALGARQASHRRMRDDVSDRTSQASAGLAKLPMIAQAAFWCSVALVFYAYLGYPMALAAIALFRNRPVRNGRSRRASRSSSRPTTRKAASRDKIDNTLAQDYPAHALEVIVASDCSSDRTDEIVSAYSPSRPPDPGAGAARQGSGAADRARVGVRGDRDLLRRRHGARAGRCVHDRRQLCRSDRRLRQQRRSLHRRRRTGQRRGRVRQVRDVPARARDPGQQSGRTERLLLRGAPGGVPALVGRSAERLQHAAQCRRDGAAWRARIVESIGYYRNIADDRREFERKSQNGRARDLLFSTDESADAEPVSLRAALVAAREPQAVPLARAVCDDRGVCHQRDARRPFDSVCGNMSSCSSPSMPRPLSACRTGRPAFKIPLSFFWRTSRF